MRREKAIMLGVVLLLTGVVVIAAAVENSKGECTREMMEEYCPEDMAESGVCDEMMGSGECTDMMNDGTCAEMMDSDVDSMLELMQDMMKTGRCHSI